MNALQKKMLERVASEKNIFDETLSQDERSAVEYLCRVDLVSYSVESGLHYFPNENGLAMLGDMREDARRQKVQERAHRGNALRSWIAIAISIIALLASFRSEILWLWMRLMQ